MTVMPSSSRAQPVREITHIPTQNTSGSQSILEDPTVIASMTRGPQDNGMFHHRHGGSHKYQTGNTIKVPEATVGPQAVVPCILTYHTLANNMTSRVGWYENFSIGIRHDKYIMLYVDWELV